MKRAGGTYLANGKKREENDDDGRQLKVWKVEFEN